MRSLYVWDAGAETPAAGFDCDQALLAALGQPRQPPVAAAYARLWHRPTPGLSFGRYHRMPVPTAPPEAVHRRLSGGKIVSLGPGVLGLTLVVAQTAWLDPDTDLGPEQVLNRALRPLLALLRELGVAAFYAGRDLVTVDGRALAHAAFTRMPDGALIIEQHLSVGDSFADLRRRLRTLDGGGVAATDPAAFDQAVTLEELARPPVRGEWTALLAREAERSFDCAVTAAAGPPPVLAGATAISADALLAFTSERGPLPRGWSSAVALQSLGVVEASAKLSGRRIDEFVISGDVIAPAATLEAISERCVGRPACARTVRLALAEVLSNDENFLFGAAELEDLVERIGS